ncbi:MAG: hypothetical protein L6R38_008170 [Xanthoria sp. 2 TBL-2021]|nr:MAG: hypothetical protein L6R38_008170 [Xanthoria sp. 2 TBL-2021]
MTSIMDPLNGTASHIDERSRLKLQDNLRGAAENMETPNDTMLRFFNAGLEVSVAKVGVDLGLFKALAATEGSLSVDDFVAKQPGADPILLERLFRYLASVRMITETGKGLYAANQVTVTLADESIEGSLQYIFNIGNPVYQAIPSFLQEQNFQTDTHGKFAWHKSTNTDLDFFPWAKQHPQQLSYFQKLMSVPRDGEWFDVVPFSTNPKYCKPDQAYFVDIGGNIGHQCRRLKAKCPTLPGRIICQDLPETIHSAPPMVQGVEMMPYDFFTPQPVQNAKFYYLRTVLHDWPDDKAEEILKNVVGAMGPDSRILIDEMVLPNTGVHWWSACLDLHMYAMLGAMERNVDQWEGLLGRCGLRVVETRTYMPVMRNSVLVVEKV